MQGSGAPVGEFDEATAVAHVVGGASVVGDDGAEGAAGRPAGGHADRGRYHRFRVTPVDVGGGALGGVIARGGLEALQQSGAQRTVVVGKLDGARGVPQHLSRFETRHVVKEPGTRGEGAQRRPFALEEHSGAGQRGGGSAGAQHGLCVRCEGGAIARDHGAVAVERRAGIGKHTRRFALPALAQLMREPRDRLAQRGAPRLRPTLLGGHRAATVGAPPLHAVHATPTRWRHELRLARGRVPREDRGEVLHAYAGAMREDAYRAGERHLAEAMVMPEGLAIDGE